MADKEKTFLTAERLYHYIKATERIDADAEKYAAIDIVMLAYEFIERYKEVSIYSLLEEQQEVFEVLKLTSEHEDLSAAKCASAFKIRMTVIAGDYPEWIDALDMLKEKKGNENGN